MPKPTDLCAFGIGNNIEVVQAPQKYSNKFNFVEFLPRSVKKIQAFSLLSLVEI